MSSSTTFISSVLPCIYKKKLKSYESLVGNMVRRIAVYYSGGITGKQKYRKLYKDSCNSKQIQLSIHNCPLPRLVPYNRLMPYIKSIDLMFMKHFVMAWMRVTKYMDVFEVLRRWLLN